jgi:hypothetical protein
MKPKILATYFLTCLSIISFGQQKNDTAALIPRPADIGLIYPISTNGTLAAYYSNRLSLQAIAGVSGAVHGCAIAGIANIIQQNSSGAVFAGILNTTGHDAKGAQFAGIVNLVSHEATGLQAAGILNRSGSTRGVQLAGIGNITSGQNKAVQAAGIFNRAAAAHTQIAGIINIAQKVTGVQMSGLINVADSSDYAIGFINLIKNGEKSIGVSTNESLNTLLSFYSGGRILYGVIGIGYNLKSHHSLYALQGGIGAHLFRAGNHFRLNAEALQLVQTDFSNGHCFTYALQALPEIKIGSRLEAFAGPTADLQLDYSHEKISGLVNHHFWTTTGRNGHFIGAYIGITGGLKFIL